MASLLNMSGGSLLGKGLPYDAEIEYLESSGTQYIDTGISGGTNAEYKIVFKIGEGNTNWSYMFGSSRLEYAAPRVQILDKDNLIAFYGVRDNNIRFDGCDTNTIYTIIYSNGDFSLGNNHTNIGILGFGTKNFCIFCCLAEPNLRGKGFIYKAEIYLDGVIRRDLIPVRVGNVGYMYDKVSKQLFGNAGTGSFILGPDK